MIAAIAEMDAAAAPAAVAPIRENVRTVAAQCKKTVNPTAKKRPEIREPVQPADGEKVTHFRCKECDFTRSAPIFHKNWARHCNDYHKEEDDDAEDTNDDGDDDVDQPGRRAELPGSAMLLSTNPAATHSVLLSRRSAAGQRKQSSQPRRKSAAGGTLPGIKGHRLQSGQKRRSK